jgi:transcriptional regulator with XRE-family HTH domain
MPSFEQAYCVLFKHFHGGLDISAQTGYSAHAALGPAIRHAKRTRMPLNLNTVSPGAASNEALEINISVGVQLRHARLVKGLRLKDVADLSNCSESMISKIENNKVAPSLNTLHRIAKALGTSVATLLQDRSANGKVVIRENERQVIPAADPASASSAMLQAFLVRLQPGAGSDGDLQHEGEEVGFVTSGQLLLTVAGISHRLNKGDSFFFPSTSLHSFLNPGSTVTEVIWVNTPPSL